jgi:Flp pilus assembly protein TadG
MRRPFLNRSDASGQTLVEFALIVPIFILMMVGIFDVGRAVYAYSTINNAAHEAVRLAIVDQNTADVRSRAVSQSVAVGVNSADVGVRWLSSAYADVAPCNATPRYGCAVEVSVAYDFNAATPIIGQLMGTIGLEAVARQQIERTYTSP